MRVFSLLAAAFIFASSVSFSAEPAVAPDFTLKDVSYGSPRRSQPVSPRDYLLQVSAWYFGDAT